MPCSAKRLSSLISGSLHPLSIHHPAPVRSLSSLREKVGDQYDWTTGGPYATEMNGGSIASYLARTPRVPFLMLIFIGLEAKGSLDFQGRRGIASVVRWKLRPVIFGFEKGHRAKSLIVDVVCLVFIGLQCLVDYHRP